MSSESNVAKAGLEGIVAAQSAISDVNGIEGRLIYQGYDIHDLAQHAAFKEVVYLLWHGKLPNKAELDELSSQLRGEVAPPDPIIRLIQDTPKEANPMDALRTAVSALSFYDPDGADMSREANLRRAVRLTAKFPTIVGTFHRVRNGQQPVEPRKDLSLAGSFLYTLWGKEADDVATRTMDVAFVLHADHKLNASTFAARVTAATLSDMYSAITSAIGALKGPLHGGANEAVFRILESISKSGADPVEYVKGMLAQKKKMPGFGHRVYHTEDPRATHLRQMSRDLGNSSGESKWFDYSRKIEEFVKADKKLNANVDFYSASTYHTLGIDVDLFTPVFAVSRISGWTAHVIEQLDDNRLIRPRAEYVGPAYPNHYLAMEKR